MMADVVDFCRSMPGEKRSLVESADSGDPSRVPTEADVVRAFRELTRLCRAYETAPDGFVREARLDAFRARLELTRIADHFYNAADSRGKVARRRRRAEALLAIDRERP